MPNQYLKKYIIEKQSNDKKNKHSDIIEHALIKKNT